MHKEICFPSLEKNVRYAENLVDEVSEKYEVHSDIYGKIMVCVVEAVNNAIVHGNKLDPEMQVRIAYKVNDEELIFSVHDEGKGFDYAKIPDPTAPENIENPYGRGIFLIKNLADEIQFLNNGSSLEIRFKIF